jgi:capsid protein
LKDMQASVLSVEKGFSSARHIIAEGGGDIEDVYSDQAADKQLAEQYGLDFPKDIQPTAPRGGSITGQPTE